MATATTSGDQAQLSQLSENLQSRIDAVRGERASVQARKADLEGRLQSALSLLTAPGSAQASAAAAPARGAAKPAKRSAAKPVAAQPVADAQVAAAKPARKPARKSKARKQVSSEERIKQVRELLTSQSLSLKDLSEKLGVSGPRVQQIISPLVEAGEIIREDDPTSTRGRKLLRIPAAA